MQLSRALLIKAIQEQQEMIIQQQLALEQQALVIQDLVTRLNILEHALVSNPVRIIFRIDPALETEHAVSYTLLHFLNEL